MAGIAWAPSTNGRQKHGKDAGKSRWQKAGDTLEKVTRRCEEITLGILGVTRWRLKVSAKEEWTAIVREAKVVYGPQ